MSRAESGEILNKDTSLEMRKRKSKTGCVLKTVGIVVMVVVLTVCLGLAIPKLTGYDTYV